MNWTVVIWTMIALTGLALSIRLSWEAWKDRGVLKRAAIGNGRVALATTWLVTECDRVLMHAMYATLGIGILLGIPMPAAAMLIAGNLLIMVNSLLGLRYRRLLNDTRDAEAGALEETPIQRQDREVGDIRRESQLNDPDTLPTPKE